MLEQQQKKAFSCHQKIIYRFPYTSNHVLPVTMRVEIRFLPVTQKNQELHRDLHL